MIFYKSRSETITPENVQDTILISSILNSPIDSFYHLIHDIYSPVLSNQQQDSKLGNIVDSKLINTLADLENSLKSAIRKLDGDTINKKTSNYSPLDEFQYWGEIASRGKQRSEKERADNFYKIFTPLLKLYESINTLAIQELIEVIETTQEVYDDVWKQLEYEPAYSQERMINLLEITGVTLLKAIQSKITKLKVFDDAFIDVKEALKHSISACERWSECCKILTKNYWKNFTPHPWSGDEFVPVFINKFCKRLKEVYEIRAANEQYNNLTSSNKGEDKQENKGIFSVFSGIEPLQYNPFTEPVWQSAVSQYNRSMLSYDQKISQILKNHLAKNQSNPQQVKIINKNLND